MAAVVLEMRCDSIGCARGLVLYPFTAGKAGKAVSVHS